MNKKVLSIKQTAALLGVSTITLWRMRNDEELGFPNPVRRTGSSIGFFEHEVLEWLESRRVKSTSVK